ncbi:MAG: SCO family protein [Tepidisphaeraceae bacterium]
MNRLALPLSLAACALCLAGANPPAQIDNLRPTALDGVGIDQKLDAQVPLDLVFRDEQGRDVRIGDLMTGRPVVLALVYYQCPMLCTLVLNDMTRAMNAIPLTVGKDFDVITVSFDARETPKLARDKKIQYVRAYNRHESAAAWHFLTGEESSIRALTDAVGFRYAWDEKSQQFAHPSGMIILTPQGRVSRYFFGLTYEPKDVRLSLVEASNNKIGTLTDKLLLFCFHYDPATGRYSLAVLRTVQVGGVATLAALATVVGLMIRKDRRSRIANG